jgi:Xaa-Pro aminopeptidase
VITTKEARLWTDGRYYAQAQAELPKEWTLMKLEDTPLELWLLQNLDKGSRIGVDPLLVSAATAYRWKDALSAGGLELVATAGANLVDQIWEGKPLAPCELASVHPLKWAGESVKEKLRSIRKLMREKNCKIHLVTALDDLAWLFNLRGRDIEFNPVLVAYAVVTLDSAALFVDQSKLTPEVKEHLTAAGVTHNFGYSYDELASQLHLLLQEAAGDGSGGHGVLLDPQQCNWALYECLASSSAEPNSGDEPTAAAKIVEGPSVVTELKAAKNDYELGGMRAAHIRDGAALVRYFAWLEGALQSGQEIDECSADDVLESLRADECDNNCRSGGEGQPSVGGGRLFVSPSFDTISAMGPNGAIVHYKPEPATCSVLHTTSLYLCDSGGQYLDGTTDCTRTMHFGRPSCYQRECFTRVLMGHIALATATFPVGTRGSALDSLARRSLWAAGLDYAHGTGHGVGAFLNVHEGPAGISKRARADEATLVKGMVLSIEPGYYEEGRFGIRIENLYEVQEDKEVGTTVPREGGREGGREGAVPFLKFAALTVVPIQRSLIQVELLSAADRDWVDAYHARVHETLAPVLQQKHEEKLVLGKSADAAAVASAVEWLTAATEPLEVPALPRL